MLLDANDKRAPEEFPRLSARYRIDGLELTWSPKSGRLTASSKGKEVPAKVIDLSVAGALLVAPANRHVEPGVRVPVRIGNSTGVAEVRSIRKASIPGMVFYGVAFTQMSKGLAANVNAVVERIRKSGSTRKAIPQK